MTKAKSASLQLNGFPKLVISVDCCQLCVGKNGLNHAEDEFYEFESLSILKSIGKIPKKTMDD